MKAAYLTKMSEAISDAKMSWRKNFDRKDVRESVSLYNAISDVG
jgi:hypothetical protein